MAGPSTSNGAIELMDVSSLQDGNDIAERQTMEESMQRLASEIQRIQSFVTISSHQHIDRLVKDLSKIQNENDLIGSLVDFRARFSSSHRRGGKIRVQPTSVSRRRDGVSRGSKRLPMGRPSSATTVNRIKKRAHKLSVNINANVANAKSHGAGH